MDFDIRKWLDENQAQWPSKWTPEFSQELPRAPQRAIRHTSVIRRARYYISKMAPAVQGQDGSGKALNVACVLINGFDLSKDQAKPLFEEWSNRCDPPWRDGEIDHKLEEAADKDEDKPKGYLIHRQQEQRQDRPRRNRTRPTPCQETPTALATTQERGIEPNNNNELNAEDFNPPGNGIEYDDNRIEVEIVPKDEYIANLETMAALAADPRIFQRAGMLVEDIRVNSENNKSKSVRHNQGSCEVSPLSLPKIRHFISECVTFFKMVPFKNEDDEIDYKKVYTHIPDWCSKSMHKWGGYPIFRPLDGITEAPILHMDGSIFNKYGYDPETCLIYRSAEEFPPMPDNPSKEDAKKAADRLFDLVCDFPWEEIDNDKGMIHKAAWLSGLLSVLCRHLVDGCCPGFLFTANAAGTGKSILADLISIIATGRKMPATVYKKNEDEMKKSIMSILMAAKQFILFDNIENGGSFGGSAIDALLTSSTYSDRPLATNSMPEIFVSTVFFATGNQISFTGDTLRRFVTVKIKSYLESPELRLVTDFKIKEEIRHYAATHRTGFVIDALTIVKAYIKAGMPKSDLVSMGSYYEWSKIIRESIYWATGYDPAKSQQHFRKDDQVVVARETVVNGWYEMMTAFHAKAVKAGIKTTIMEDGLTVGQAVDIMNSSPDEYKQIRNYLKGLSKFKDDFPPPNIIGKFLGINKDKVTGGRYLKKVEGTPEGTKWVVIEVKATAEDAEESTDDGHENAKVEGIPF